MFLGGHGSDDLVVGDGGPRTVGECPDRVGDRVLSLQHLHGRVGLLAGALDADQRDDGAGAADAVEDQVEVRRIPPVEARRDLGDQVRAGEHLVAAQQVPVDVDDLSSEGVDFVCGQRARR
jgi:hypothetical protein